MLECPEMDINEEKNESNNAVGLLLSPESGRRFKLISVVNKMVMINDINNARIDGI